MERLISFSRLVSASRDGLLLIDEGRESLAPRFLVDEVFVESLRDDADVSTLLMFLQLGDDRLVVVAEGHPVWLDFVELVPRCLPGTVAFPVWSLPWRLRRVTGYRYSSVPGSVVPEHTPLSSDIRPATLCVHQAY